MSAPSSGNSRKSPSRGESLAYPPSNTATFFSKMQFLFRQHSKAVLMTCVAITVIMVLFSERLGDWHAQSATAGGMLRSPWGSSSSMSAHWGGALNPGYFTVANSKLPANAGFRFAAVTDLDELSLVKGSKKWRSVLVPGRIAPTATGTYTISFEKTRTLTTKHNEGGRGAEFSELAIYNDRLLTFDDRTGDVFEVLNEADGQSSLVVPRFVITEGTGDTDKGMKWEWATVKGGELYLGSMGKKYTRPDGSVVNTHNLWIAVIDGRGQVRRENWAAHYDVVRQALHATDPGYVIIEAVNWSDALQKWVFLPRRISSDAYDENKDERKGGNKIVLVDPNFERSSTPPQVVEITGMSKDPLRGFSTFAFVPGTNDEHAMAIRSVEEDCVGGDDAVCKQRSYFLIFNVLTGKVLSDEMEFPEGLKFEGLEFVDMYTKPPPEEAAQ